MNNKQASAPKKAFDKQAFLKVAEKVAKILEKEKAQQTHA